MCVLLKRYLKTLFTSRVQTGTIDQKTHTYQKKDTREQYQKRTRDTVYNVD